MNTRSMPETARRRKLTPTEKRVIEAEAVYCAREQLHRMGAKYSHPYDSSYGQHWLATYLVSGGKFP